ncbi:MAG: hypothetical protein COB14_04380 [Alphaproteobacteria bacterium]|nr:MAG: hypothetical protein COB14_04380 [Alphaproteobacteria bacterium]
MKLKTTSLLIAATLFGAAVAPAQANNDAMVDLLKVLRDKGTISAQDFDLLTGAAKADKEASEEIANKVAKVEKEATTISLKGGHLKIKSADKAFSAQIGGRVMVDYASMNEDDLGGKGNASELRRARLFVKGTAFTDFGYKLQLDFGSAGKDGKSVAMKDAYIQYNGWKPAKITLGNHKMPFGLEELTSSKYITFIERSAASEAFGVGRKNGLSIGTSGSNWTLKGAVHMNGTLANNSGQDEDFGYGARVTFAPLSEKTQVIHLGAAFHHQEFGNEAGEELQLEVRPEVHTAGKIFKSYEDKFEDMNQYGLEAAAVFGPFSVQAEYVHASFNAIDGSEDQDLESFYVYGSYFITGESRKYKKGEFSRVKPKSIVGQGGTGAWEVALRYSDLDLEDNGLGNAGDVTTIGLNWYATPTVRVMANYTSADVDGEDDDFNAFNLRGQIDF